jgi:catechol 2,3-dioxygenase-like lactoylglutathione lyase family enzyme
VVLPDFPIHATAAASDLDRARAWYEQKLGLVPEREDQGGAWYGFAGDTWLYHTEQREREPPTTRSPGWTATDIEAVMTDLRGRGIISKTYDFGQMKTIDGLADFGKAKAA